MTRRRWLGRRSSVGCAGRASATAQGAAAGARPRHRARAPARPGPLNAITDVAGVRGRARRRSSTGDTVRTGVTAILPHGGNLFREKVPGAVFVGNAFGKLAGSTQVEELGTIETPIVLTNTLSVGAALDGVVALDARAAGQRERALGQRRSSAKRTTATLNDIRGLHVTREHVRRRSPRAKTGAVDEGAVGAGTGTVAFGWKGGIGTSSRVVRQQARRVDGRRARADQLRRAARRSPACRCGGS